MTSHPDLLAGLAWGKPRGGHPEGQVGHHVADLLARIDRSGYRDMRSPLRFVALVHDSFKYRVGRQLPRTGENHHAMRARRFAERFSDDERPLTVIELHDRPYAIWRGHGRKPALHDRRFDDMMSKVADPGLFLAFVELDGSTEGKSPEPTRWFREQLERRGLRADHDGP